MKLTLDKEKLVQQMTGTEVGSEERLKLEGDLRDLQEKLGTGGTTTLTLTPTLTPTLTLTLTPTPP